MKKIMFNYIYNRIKKLEYKEFFKTMNVNNLLDFAFRCIENISCIFFYKRRKKNHVSNVE